MATCDPCLWTKVHHQQPTGELNLLSVLEECWDMSVDFIVELPESGGYNMIMVVVDSVGKRAHFMETVTTITAAGTANLYLCHVWKHHRLSCKVISNQGAHFIVEFMKELYQLLGIKIGASMVYHLQTDRQTEQINQELEQFIQLFVNEHQDNWNSLLPLAEFAYNNHVHSLTQQTPFFLDTSQHPRMGFEPNQPQSRIETVNEFTDQMKATLEEVKSALAKSKDDMARYYN